MSHTVTQPACAVAGLVSTTCPRTTVAIPGARLHARLRPSLSLCQPTASGAQRRRACSVAVRSAASDDVGEPAAEAEEAPKKGRRAAAPKAPKEKKPPLTEEEKAAKEAEKLAKAEAKKKERAEAKKAADEAAKLRAEAAASRRTQRNTAKGVVAESDVVVTPGGAVVPKGMQWYGLQCIDGKERYCEERLTFRFQRYFGLVPGQDFEVLVARYPTEEEWKARKKAAAAAAANPGTAAPEPKTVGGALVNGGPVVIEGLVLIRIEMDELRSSAIETEPSVMQFKARMAIAEGPRGDGLKMGKLPSPIDPGLLKVLIDGTRMPPRGLEAEVAEEEAQAAAAAAAAPRGASGPQVRLQPGARVVGSVTTGGAGAGSIRVDGEAAAALRAAAQAAEAAAASGAFAPITEEDLWGAPEAPRSFTSGGAARPARDGGRDGSGEQRRDSRGVPLRRGAAGLAAASSGPGTLPPAWRVPRRSEESDAADGSGEYPMRDPERDGDWAEEEDDAWASAAEETRRAAAGAQAPRGRRPGGAGAGARGMGRPPARAGARAGGRPAAAGRGPRNQPAEKPQGGAGAGEWMPFADDE